MELESTALIVIGLFVLLNLTSKNSKLKSIEKRISNNEFMLKQIANQVGVQELPINKKLRKLVKEGKNVQAVKEARECFGYSLIEAKRYVDEL
ncbi:hypothetical protein [Virgibacillus ndiopensis]|uniref:hypothetical protein n=1 Tax=Virgibacillus ndiopensis TaxID=2004408 RepID=UPI000C08A75A|nr:hypothetical protein [Virgibacillus ndiopensis]